MIITKDFLVAEIQSLEQEIDKANVFIIQAQATVAAYRMLINKLEAPEPEEVSLETLANSIEVGEQNG